MSRRPEHRPSTRSDPAGADDHRCDEPREAPASLVELRYIGGPYDGLEHRVARKLMPPARENTFYTRVRHVSWFHGYVSHDEWRGQDSLTLYWVGVVARVESK